MSEPVNLQPLSYATPSLRRPGMATAIGILSIAIGLAYPIFLLFVLRSRRLRNYFAAIHLTRDPVPAV